MRKLRTFAWVLMLVMAVLVTIGSLRLLTLNDKLIGPPLRPNFRAYPWLFVVHLLGGGVALALGPLQLRASLRNRRLALHRRLGKVYVGACLVGGVAGLALATIASGNMIARAGFFMLAVLWLVTTTLAFPRIRRRDIPAHQRWMIRSYALTFSAVTLRIWLPLLDNALGLSFGDAYATVAWLCWMPNLAFAELLIARGGSASRQPVMSAAAASD